MTKVFRENGANWARDYDGIDHNLAGMTVNYATHQATSPSWHACRNPSTFFEETFFRKAAQHRRDRAFEIRWLCPLADWYRNSKTKLIFYQCRAVICAEDSSALGLDRGRQTSRAALGDSCSTRTSSIHSSVRSCSRIMSI